MLVLFCFNFKQAKYTETWRILFGRERPWAPLLGVHCQPKGERQVLSPTRKETAVVTDVGGADYSRAVCIQISQAVLVF